MPHAAPAHARHRGQRVPGSVQELPRPAVPRPQPGRVARQPGRVRRHAGHAPARPSPIACRRSARSSRRAARTIAHLQQRSDDNAAAVKQAEDAADGVAFADANERELQQRLARVTEHAGQPAGRRRPQPGRGARPPAPRGGRARVAARARIPARACGTPRRARSRPRTRWSTPARTTSSWPRRSATSPRASTDFARRIAELDARLNILMPRVAALGTEQQGALQEIAVTELMSQKERLAAYTAQARYAVAQLYDRATEPKEGEPCGEALSAVRWTSPYRRRAAPPLLAPAAHARRAAAHQLAGRLLDAGPRQPQAGATPDNAPTHQDAADARGGDRAGSGHPGRRGQGDRRLPQLPRGHARRQAARRGAAPPGRPADGQRRQRQRRHAHRQRHARLHAPPSRSTATTSRPIRTPPTTTACCTSWRGRRSRAAQLEEGLKTLDQLVAQYPKTRYRDEAEFRRGEILFTLRQYPKAEQAYTLVLNGEKDNPYIERALYMQGWSKFKQGNLEEALDVVLRRARRQDRRHQGRRPRQVRGAHPRRQGAGGRHAARDRHLAGQPQGRRVDSGLHHQRRPPLVRVPRLPAAGPAVPEARSARRTPPTPTPASRA